MLIRNVPLRTLDALKARARRRGRSVQAEALELLERGVEPAGAALVGWIAERRPERADAAAGIAAIRQARSER